MKLLACFALGWVTAFTYHYYKPFVLSSRVMERLGKAHVGARVRFADGGIARCFWEDRK